MRTLRTLKASRSKVQENAGKWRLPAAGRLRILECASCASWVGICAPWTRPCRSRGRVMDRADETSGGGERSWAGDCVLLESQGNRPDMTHFCRLSGRQRSASRRMPPVYRAKNEPVAVRSRVTAAESQVRGETPFVRPAFEFLDPLDLWILSKSRHDSPLFFGIFKIQAGLDPHWMFRSCRAPRGHLAFVTAYGRESVSS